MPLATPTFLSGGGVEWNLICREKKIRILRFKQGEKASVIIFVLNQNGLRNV